MTAVTKPLAQSPALQLLPFVTLALTADGKLPGSTESLLLLGFSCWRDVKSTRKPRSRTSRSRARSTRQTPA